MGDPSSNSLANIAPSEALVTGGFAPPAGFPDYSHITTTMGVTAMPEIPAQFPAFDPIRQHQHQSLLQNALHLSDMAQNGPSLLPILLQQQELAAAAAALGPFGFHNPFAFANFNPLLFAHAASMLAAATTATSATITSTGTPRLDDIYDDKVARQANSDASDAYKRGRDDTILSLVRAGGISGLVGPSQPTIPRVLRAQENVPDGMQNDEFLVSLGTLCLERRTKNINYFDASTLSDPDPVAVANRRTRGGVTEPFPEKLYRMILEAEYNGKLDVLSFFPHGRSFAIHKPERFCTEIMSKYFKQSRLSSFQRQLNLCKTFH